MITSIAHQQYNNNDGWEEDDSSGMMMDYQIAAADDQYNDEQRDAADGGGDYNIMNQQWSSTNDDHDVQYHNLREYYYHDDNNDNAQHDTRHHHNNNLNMHQEEEDNNYNNYTENNNSIDDEEVDRNRQELPFSGNNNNYNNSQYYNQQTSYSYQDQDEVHSHEYDAAEDYNIMNENEKRKGGCVTNSMNNRTQYQPRQWHEDSEYSYNNNGEDDGSVNQRQQVQLNNSREEEEEQSYYENDSKNDNQYYQQDDNYNTADEKEEEKEGQYDGIDFNQIQCPPSMFNDNQEDNNYYDADDEHNIIHQQQDEVPREVSFVPGQDESQEYDYDEDDQSLYSLQKQQHNSDDLVYSDDDNSSIIDSNNNSPMNQQQHTTKQSTTQTIFHGTSESLDVIHRIESVMESLLKYLDKKEAPVLRGYVQSRNNSLIDDDSVEQDYDPDAFQPTNNINTLGGDPKFHRSFGNIAQSRSFTSICLVMSFIHQLLLSNRTTTTREVYYVFVTHFRNQRECDGVILDVAKILGVSRRSLGLSASPKGWFCGCVEITRVGTLPSSGKDVSGCIDGTALSSIQGLPITKEWTERDSSTGCTTDGVEIKISSKDAKAILVIEKEGVYNRLSEERIFDRFPCILVTGKGFPDLATRALVSTLHNELELPVIGLCDCNPYGISVLSLYHCAGERMGVDGRMRYSVPIQWLGLRPSEVARLKDDLPETVFQKLTDLDKKRMSSLLDPNHEFLSEEDEEEVRDMEDAGYKVELEALYWLGPDYMGNWVVNMLRNEYDNDGGGDDEGIECRNVAEESHDDF